MPDNSSGQCLNNSNANDIINLNLTSNNFIDSKQSQSDYYYDDNSNSYITARPIPTNTIINTDGKIQNHH